MSVHREYHAYKLIEDDYLEVCEFIEPSDNNKTAYSHRVYELYLRICTEFESHAKALLIQHSYPKALSNPGDLDVRDYKKLYSEASYLGQRLTAEVGLKFWSPDLIFVRPFEDWVNDVQLSWYKSYNVVKHNRDSHFYEASLWNLTRAMSGLFLLIYQSKGWAFFQPYSVSRASGGSNTTGYSAQGSIFSVRGPAAGA